MSAPAAWTVAVAPLAAALLALVATYATGFDQRSAMPPDAASRFYGFFLDRYPLFAFVLVYGLARILVAALAPGRAGVPRRLIGAVLGLVLVAGAGLHPTFGGLVLRGAFGTGSVAFLNGAPMAVSYALGAAAGAGVFGLAMGIGVILTGRPGRPAARGRWRALGRGLVGMVAAFLALWIGAALIGAGRDLGLGPWPRRPLDGRDLALAAGLITAAMLPHVMLVALRLRPRRIEAVG